MKKVIAILLASVMVFSLAACGGSSSEGGAASDGGEKIGEGRTLVVGVWGDVQEELVREYVVKPFEEETGATVELILGGSGDRYSKLYAEVDNPSMDVMYLNFQQTLQATADDMILEVDPEVVTNYATLYDIAKAGNGYGVAINPIGLQYSTDSGLDAPTSWADMVGETYKGKVAPYSMPSSQMDSALVMLAKALGDEKDVDAAIKAIAEAGPYSLITDGIPERNQGHMDGDIYLGPQIAGYTYAAKDEGVPVEFCYPEEGAALSMNCAVIPKNSANADLAKIFINYHLDQACQEAYADRMYYGPANSAVVLDDELAAKVCYGEEDVSKLVALDNAWISENEAAWVELWNELVLQ